MRVNTITYKFRGSDTKHLSEYIEEGYEVVGFVHDVRIGFEDYYTVLLKKITN